MKVLRILFHMARADFLERSRRYSFLVTLGVVVWLGYASATSLIKMRIAPDYLGISNSPWIGSLMTLTVTFFLGWFGFYLIKGSVARDYTTGVGQIIATTPLSRSLYVLGKWMSNFFVLAIMIFILMLVGVVMNLWVDPAGFDYNALVAPILIIALPCMALVAALAVLFDTVSWLRGGLGNVVYFFLFGIGIIPGLQNPRYIPILDPTGFRLIGDSIAAAAKAAYPESQGGFTFSITTVVEPKLFLWNGIAWNLQVVLERSGLVVIVAGVVLAAALLFDRFNPSRPAMQRPRKGKAAPQPDLPAVELPQSVPALATLTPLAGARGRFRFDGLLIAELRLLLKGLPWWWFAAALDLLLAQLISEMEAVRFLVIAAWVWPALRLSSLGCREARYDTTQIIFSAPRPLINQLPALWLAATGMLAVLSLGGGLRFLLAGDGASLAYWLAGVIFIPSAALACGVITRSSKLFEVLYIFWIYITLQGIGDLGAFTLFPRFSTASYLGLAVALLALAAWVRRSQLTARSSLH